VVMELTAFGGWWTSPYLLQLASAPKIQNHTRSWQRKDVPLDVIVRQAREEEGWENEIKSTFNIQHYISKPDIEHDR